MAGVRPQLRGGIGGFQIPVIWFIGAVVLWVVSTVLLVVLYTDQAKIKADMERLTRERNQLVQPNERDALRRYLDRSGGRSLLGMLESEREATTALLTGDGSLDYPAAAKQFNDALRSIVQEQRLGSAGDLSNTNAIQAVNTLYTAFKGQQDEANRLSAANEELRTQTEAIRKSLNEERERFGAKTEEMEQQIVKLLQNDYDALRTARDREVEDLRTTLEQVRDEAARAARTSTEHTDELNTQNERLLTMIERLRDQLAEFSPEADPALLLKQADGRVVDVLVGEKLAYINLGSRDRLKRGMTFAVYPSDGRLPESGEGKATLEVTKVYPETAECHIQVSRPGDPVIPGDYVSNVVFDKKRSFRFRVAGRFDLDYDGQLDPRGKETVEAMIAEWGGTVVDAIDERTDFVVLGAPPVSPNVYGDSGDADMEALRKQAADEAAAFERIRDEAAALSIPLLNQTQFLNLIGFEYTFQLAEM
jgi:hypothetical protein